MPMPDEPFAEKDPVASYLADLQDEGEEEPDGSTSISATGSASATSIHQQSMNIERSAKKTLIVAFLVVLMGAAASSGFMYLGITNAKGDKEDQFERRAMDLAKEIDSSWRDYESAALWIHESCLNWREENFTRKDFRVLYEYIKSGGLEFRAAELVPRIEHKDRAALETEAYKFLASHPELNHTYQGLMGQEPSPEDPNALSYQPRSVQPFYYPIHFVEPLEEQLSVFHYDLYSPPWEQPTIQKALDTWEPALTGRFVLYVQLRCLHTGFRVFLYVLT